MSRTKKSIKNANIAIFFLVATTLMNFVSRSVFIDTLGDQIVGLSATLLNILGFLNLAELGLSSAISSTLFKPLYDGDRNTCCDIVSIYGYLYRIIGLSILALGVILSLFLPHFFGNSGVEMVYVYAGFYTYLSTALIGYFINYKQTILSADQNEYKISFRYNITVLIRLLVQIAILKLFSDSYIFWLVIELFFALVYGGWINRTVAQSYKWLETSFERGKRCVKQYKQLTKNILQVIPHNVGAFVLFQTDNILIYGYASLTMVTMYTNYTLILNRAAVIINTAMRGVSASVGNLVASGDKAQIKKVFFEMTALLTILATVATVTFLFQTDAFISLWVGEQYVLDKKILYLMLFTTYIGITRLAVSNFLGGYVLYKDVWAPIAEASINLVVSLVLGYYYGILGVVLGTVISLSIIVVIWKPYFLYREGFRESSKEYWVVFIRNLLLLGLSIIITYILVKYIPLPSNQTWSGFILKSILIAGFSGIVVATIMCQFDKYLFLLIKRIIIYSIKRQ